MVNALFPADVDVTINGSTFTTKISSFEESGGTKNVSYRKSLGRKHKKVRGVPDDWNVSFEGTITDKTFEEVFQLEDSFTVVLDWTGSQTFTYNNVDSATANYLMSADDRLTVSVSFSVPFYDINGSQNRVVS